MLQCNYIAINSLHPNLRTYINTLILAVKSVCGDSIAIYIDILEVAIMENAVNCKYFSIAAIARDDI